MAVQAPGFGKVIDAPFAETLERTRAALREQGFGVITEIDVQATMRQKLGRKMRPYTILGACHPESAYRVLTAEPEMGLLLPCNVIVYETDDGTRVSAIDAREMLAMSAADGLDGVAAGVDAGLRQALELL